MLSGDLPAPPPAEATASGQDTADVIGTVAILYCVSCIAVLCVPGRDKSNIPEVSSKYATDC